MITENLSTLKIHKLTQAQYDRELAAGNIDENALYLTPDEAIDLSPYATVEQLNEKADVEHTHEIGDVDGLQISLDRKADSDHTHSNYVPTTRTVNGKVLSADITLSASDIGALSADTSIPDALSDLAEDATHRTVTDTEKATWNAKSDTDTTYSAGDGISLSSDNKFSNSGVRSIATGSANGTIFVNTNGTSADVSVKGLGSAAYTASTAYDAAGTAQTKADAALASAKSYADDIKNDLLNGAGEAYDTLKELGELIDENVDAIEALEQVASGKADADHNHDDRYYTESEVDDKIDALNTAIANITAITNEEIDAICGATVYAASEVMF